MTVYIASRFLNKSGVKSLTAKLATAVPPIHCIQTWPDEVLGSDTKANALRDLQQIQEADTVLVWTDACEKTPGGMNFETGYAYALGKNIIQVGPRVHIFLNLKDIKHYDSIQDFFRTLNWE